MSGQRRSAASRARIVVRGVHLWLGLGLGLLFAVLSLTGSALVFYTGIDAALHPAVRVVQAGPAPDLASRVWDRALATGRARWHDPAGKWTIEVTGEGGTIPARFYPSSGHGHHADRMMVWFSPDGTRIVRAEPWGGYLMSWLYQLHMALLAGDLGGRAGGLVGRGDAAVAGQRHRGVVAARKLAQGSCLQTRRCTDPPAARPAQAVRSLEHAAAVCAGSDRRVAGAASRRAGSVTARDNSGPEILCQRGRSSQYRSGVRSRAPGIAGWSGRLRGYARRARCAGPRSASGAR